MYIMMKILEMKNVEEAATVLKDIGCDELGIKIMQHKAVFKTVKIENIRSKAANLLKQTFLAKGADVALARGCADLSVEHTDVLVMGTIQQYKRAIPQLRMQPWGLKAIADKLESLVLTSSHKLPFRLYEWSDRSLQIDENHSLVMGILNVTPDSFSDGGKYNNLDAAIRHVETMQAEGADIIDIGAESTRPYGGNEKITSDQELARLLPLLEAVLSHCSVPVSIDTYKASVAEEALRRGAHIINDIWGLQYDQAMAKVVAKYNAPIVVMHNQQEIAYSSDIMQDICDFLQKSIQIGIENKINSDNIIVDPGIGFAKNFDHNIQIMRNIERLQNLHCPVLLGASRKRFIGEVLDLPPAERAEGTAATAALGKMKGVQIHRVHDVKVVKRLLKMLDAMMD